MEDGRGGGRMRDASILAINARRNVDYLKPRDSYSFLDSLAYTLIGLGMVEEAETVINALFTSVPEDSKWLAIANYLLIEYIKG